MAIEYLDDGNTSFIYGQDAYHHPNNIRNDQYAKGVNVTSRRGTLSSRSGFEEIKLTFEDQTIVSPLYRYTRTIEDVFRSGKFQAFIPYFFGSEYYLLVVISGLIFRINTRKKSVTLLSDTIKVNQYAARINWSLANEFIVIFDFPDFPVLVKGDVVTRASPTHTVNGNLQPQVPISNLGTFNQNRLFVANAGNAFTAGDPVGSLATPEAPVTFTEVLTPFTGFTGQSFSLGTGTNAKPITAMGFIQSLDASTGIGPLFVANEDLIFYYRTDLPRSQWELVQFGSLLLFNAGIVGTRAVTNVNSDLLFMSGAKKIHALSTGRNDAKRWGNIPISREVENYIKFLDKDLAQFAVLNYHDNRVFITVNPYRVQSLDRDMRPVTDYAHSGMVILGLDNVASLFTEPSPVWDGLWTGINPLDIAISKNDMYVMSKDRSTINRLYQYNRDTKYDIIDGHVRPIESVVYTKEYEFQAPYLDKKEHSITLPFSDVKGDFSVKVERKPSHAENFALWGEFNHKAIDTICASGLPYPQGISPHNFKGIIIGSPTPGKDCTAVSGELFSGFRKEQFRLTITGNDWVLDSLKVKAIKQETPDNISSCPDDYPENVIVGNECNPDWKLPENTLCTEEIKNGNK